MELKPLGSAEVIAPEIGLGTWHYYGGMKPLRRDSERGCCVHLMAIFQSASGSLYTAWALPASVWQRARPLPEGEGEQGEGHLYALDVPSLGLPRGSAWREVGKAMRNHRPDDTELMGLYKRSRGEAADAHLPLRFRC